MAKPTEQNVAKSWTCPKCGYIVVDPPDPPKCPRCKPDMTNKGSFAINPKAQT